MGCSQEKLLSEEDVGVDLLSNFTSNEYLWLAVLNSTTKNMDAFEERNNIFSKDPDVSRFDSERILCNLCDT